MFAFSQTLCIASYLKHHVIQPKPFFCIPIAQLSHDVRGLIFFIKYAQQDIVDFVSDNFEIPLAQAKENGEVIDEKLLKLAASVITEITTNPDW